MEYQVSNQMKIGILQVVKRKQGDFVWQEGDNIYPIFLDQTIVQVSNDFLVEYKTFFPGWILANNTEVLKYFLTLMGLIALSSIWVFDQFCDPDRCSSCISSSVEGTFHKQVSGPLRWLFVCSCQLQLWLLMGLVEVLKCVLVDLTPSCDSKVLHQVFLHRKVDGNFFLLVWHAELMTVLRWE